MKRYSVALLLLVAFFATWPQTSGARWMNPQTERFHTMDTYEGDQHDPPSLHPFIYAENDPGNKQDPGGHEVEGWQAAINAVQYVGACVTGQSGTASSLFQILTSKARPLTPGEIDLAKTIYGANIDYNRPGVNYGKWFLFQETGREMTPEGIIYTGGVVIPDYSQAAALSTADFVIRKSHFIHEMCHVWQYQQGMSVFMRGALNRNYDYYDSNFGNRPFNSYGIEQQAQMTSDYYLLRNNSRSDTTPTPPPALATYKKVIPFLPQ